MCHAYIQPSFFEGFGLSVLEAMSCGAPIISSNAGSLPEVAGSAALYFNPNKEKSLLNQLVHFSHLPPTQVKQYQSKSISQSKKFSFTKTAQLTIMAYKKSVKNK